MPYSAPPASALDFAFGRALYSAPPASATDFDFVTGAGSTPSYSRIPGVIAAFGTPWAPKPAKRESALSAIFKEAAEKNIERRGNANSASQVLDERTRAPFQAANERSRQAGLAWDAVQPRERKNTVPSTMAAEKDIEAQASSWAAPSYTPELDVAGPFLVKTPWKDQALNERYFSSALYAKLWRKPENLPATLALYQKGRADFGMLTINHARLRDVHALGGIFENNPIQPKDSGFVAPHGDAPARNIAPALPWGPSGYRDTTLKFEYPTYTGPVIIPGELIEAEEKETYTIMNTVNVKRVSDNTPIEMQNLTIALDVDSWAWTVTGELIGRAALALVEPSASGLVDIEVTLNGHIWIFMIEGYTENRAFANHRFQVKGSSRTQYLAAPYAPERSKTYTADILASQVIDDELQNTGFTLAWSTTAPWLIDADALSYQKQSPIAVAKRIAETVGAIIVPAKAADSLTLKPRLRISPWGLATAANNELDAQIPMAMVTQISHDYVPAPLYNAVYCSGTSTGISALVELTGTGGTAPAPDVFDDLMTDTDAATERARQEIGASGKRGLYALTLPVPEFVQAPGLLEPGMVIETVEGTETWRGYVLGVSINAPRTGAEKIEQTASIVRFYEH